MSRQRCGRDNHPFLTLNDRNYHAINGRVEYRAGRLRATTAYRQHYNVNSPSVLSFHSSHSRTYSAGASFVLNRSLWFDANYSRLHLDSAGSLAFFAGSPRPTLQRASSSLFLSNIHSANFAARFSIGRRTILHLGYNITRDSGDGRAAGVAPDVADPVQQVFGATQTFLLSYQSPMARVSFRIAPKISVERRLPVLQLSPGFQPAVVLAQLSREHRAHQCVLVVLSQAARTRPPDGRRCRLKARSTYLLKWFRG